MVMTLDRESDVTTGRRTGDGVVLAGVDRAREFRRAAQRTTVVRTLKVVLPLCCVSLLATYAFTIAQTAGIVDAEGLPELALRKVLPTDLVMKNPRYEGYNKDGGRYVFAAQTAQQEGTSMSVVLLNGITGELYQADGTRTDVTAARGRFDNGASVLQLFDEINVDSKSGLKARLTEATIRTKDDLLTSGHPVLVEFPNGSVRGDRLVLRQKLGQASFGGNVVAELTPPAQEAAAKPPADQTAMFTPSGGPIIINSDELHLNEGLKLATFRNDVHARQGDATISTPELQITYEGEGMMRAPAASADAAGKLRRIVAKKPVVIKRGNGDVVTSDNADFDAAAQIALLTGEVIMTSGVDRRATSDQVELNEATGAIVLTGSVVVTQGGNELSGGRLAIDRTRGTAQLTTPPEGAYGPGRIKARFVRDARAKAPDRDKAVRADDQSALMSFQTNASAPIELNADALNVDDGRKVAVFRGDVDATQDGFKIRCAELSAFYKGGSGLVDVANPGATAAGGQPASELSRIEARKSVRVTSKDGQTATGDWADFDVKSNKITMGGNVVLSRGKSMVRGTRFLIDLTTGESKIDTAPPNTESRPSGGGWVTNDPSGTAGQSKGRASAVFFPQELKEQENAAGQAKTKPTSPGEAVDGWSATSKPD